MLNSVTLWIVDTQHPKTDSSEYHCSELMYSVIFNYWQYWTILWTKILYRGNSVPKLLSTLEIQYNHTRLLLSLGKVHLVLQSAYTILNVNSFFGKFYKNLLYQDLKYSNIPSFVSAYSLEQSALENLA